MAAVPGMMTALAQAADDWYALSEDQASITVTLPQYVDGAYWDTVTDDQDMLEVTGQTTQADGTTTISLSAASNDIQKEAVVTVMFDDRIEGRQSIFSTYELEIEIDPQGRLSVIRQQPAWYVLYPDTNKLEIWMYADDTTGYEWTYTSDSDVLYTSGTTFIESDDGDGSGWYYTKFGADAYDGEDRYVTLRLIYGYGIFRDTENIQAQTRTLDLYVGGDGTLGVFGYSAMTDYAAYLQGNT